MTLLLVPCFSPLAYLRGVVTRDMVRFASFCGLSAAVYRAAMALMERYTPHWVSLFTKLVGVIWPRYFRGWYVQASMELGPEDVSLLERCPHFRG